MFYIWIFGSNCPGINRHRVHIIQHYGIRTNRAHAFADRPQMWHGAQPPHDAANANRVAYCLAQPVFFRDVKVTDRAGPKTTDLKGNNNKIGILQGIPLNTVAGDGCPDPKRFDNLASHQCGFFQPLCINIHQCDMGI